MKRWTGVDRLRQLIGLVRHVGPDLVQKGVTQRGIRAFGWNRDTPRGTCRWCGRACKRSRLWHGPCFVAYLAATTQSGKLINKLHPPGGGAECEFCGRVDEGWDLHELDHIDALGLASASGDWQRYRRALSLDNLQWLCSECHRHKTAHDRKLIRRAQEEPMPIRPENKDRYPHNWLEIRDGILERADHKCEACGVPNYEDHPVTGAKVVLTIAHLDHMPEHNDPSNLRAWCQRCHNRYDMPVRRVNRSINARRDQVERGQLELWEEHDQDQDNPEVVVRLEE